MPPLLGCFSVGAADGRRVVCGACWEPGQIGATPGPAAAPASQSADAWCCLQRRRSGGIVQYVRLLLSDWQQAQMSVAVGSPVHCPVCVYDAERMAPVPNWGFWWRCGSCRLEFVQPMRLSKSPQVLFESAYRGGMHENAMDEFRRRVTQRSSVLKEPSLWFWTPAFGRVFEWLEVRLKPGATVLELGCGLGIVLHELQGRGFKVHGLDVAELAVNLNRNDGFPVWHGPLESMPDDWMAKPDAVIAFFMLHHLEDPIRMIRDVSRRWPNAL